MNSKYRQRWFTGVAAGAAASAALIVLARKKKVERLALAAQADSLTQRALSELGVPAQSTFIRANGLWFHAILAGSEHGPLVVLLHGFPECWVSWRKQIAPLVKAGYRVLVPDQRGYNLSDKPFGVASYQIDRLTSDVAELIHAVNRERAVIVAHDWGGAVAWRFAMDYPGLVEKLVVMNAPHPKAFARELASHWSQRLKSWYMFFFQLPWLPEATIGFSPTANAQAAFRRSALRAGAFSELDIDVIASGWSQPHALTSMIDWYRAAFRFRPAQHNKTVEAPTLLIWAEDDFALGKPLTHGLDKWVTNLKIHYISNCGHWVQNEAPDEVNTQLLAFLQSPHLPTSSELSER